MLGEAISIFCEKGIMKKNHSINDNITKVIVTNGTGRRGPACDEAVTSADTQPLSEPPDGEAHSSESLGYMRLDVSPYNESTSEGNSEGNIRKRQRSSKSSA